MRRELDQFFKGKLEQIKTDYDPAAWSSVEQMLDERDGENRIAPWIWLTSGFVALSLLAFIFLPATEDEKVHAPHNLGSSFPVSQNLSYKSNKHDSHQSKILLVAASSLIQKSSKRKKAIAHQAPWYPQRTFFEDIPNSSSPVSASSNPSLLRNKRLTFSSSTAQERSAVNDVNPIPVYPSSFVQLTADKSIGQAAETKAIQILAASPWKLGMGASISYDWAGNYGLWADVSYSLSPMVSIGLRPGIGFRSQISNTEVLLTQQKYDFGSTRKEFRCKLQHQFTLEIPAYAMIHKRGHMIHLGLGAEKVIAQRATIAETMTSDYNNMRRRQVWEAKIHTQQTKWVEPITPISGFAEAGYAYQLFSNLSLGLRTRLYILRSNNEELLHNQHRFNFALQMNWKL